MLYWVWLNILLKHCGTAVLNIDLTGSLFFIQWKNMEERLIIAASSKTNKVWRVAKLHKLLVKVHVNNACL